MILLCVTPSGKEVPLRWCSWYAAVPSMPPGTTGRLEKKKQKKYSRSLRLLGLSHVMLKKCQTTEQKHCHIAWECYAHDPHTYLDNTGVILLLFLLCRLLVIMQKSCPRFLCHFGTLCVSINCWDQIPYTLVLNETLHATLSPVILLVLSVSGDKACSPLLAESSQCHFLNKF